MCSLAIYWKNIYIYVCNPSRCPQKISCHSIFIPQRQQRCFEVVVPHEGATKRRPGSQRGNKAKLPSQAKSVKKAATSSPIPKEQLVGEEGPGPRFLQQPGVENMRRHVCNPSRCPQKISCHSIFIPQRQQRCFEVVVPHEGATKRRPGSQRGNKAKLPSQAKSVKKAATSSPIPP